MGKKLLLLVPVIVLSSILVFACKGIPAEEYDSVVAELSAVQSELETVQDDLEAEVTNTAEERDAAQSELEDLKSMLDTLIVAGDLVRGHIPSEFGPSCALTSQYRRGEMIVWRFRIWDPETGLQLPADPSELVETQPDAEQIAALTEGLKVAVHLSDGQTFDAFFGGHGGTDEAKEDYFWTAGWEIPVDYPTGTLDDWVTVEWTEGGKTGESQPFEVSSSKITILEEVITAALEEGSE